MTMQTRTAIRSAEKWLRRQAKRKARTNVRAAYKHATAVLARLAR